MAGGNISRALGKKLWAVAGFVAFGLGFIGAVLPILPTTPFILLAGFCFARSSEKVDRWFKGTKLYRNVFESYATRRTMTAKAKLTLLLPITALLAISFFLMRSVPVAQAIIAVVWAAHIVYFGFVVKTERPAPTLEDVAPNAEGRVI